MNIPDIVDVKVQDIIRDYEEGEPIDIVPKKEIIREPNGVIREVKSGKFVKGSRPQSKIKHDKLSKILERKVGPDIERAIQKLAEIALYDPDMPEVKYDKETGETKVGKKLFHFYNAATQMQALTLMLKYYYGNPRKEIQIDQHVDVKIEKKVADLTKLINANQERLQIVNGGKK